MKQLEEKTCRMSVELVPHVLVGAAFATSLVPSVPPKLRHRAQLGAHALLGVLLLVIPDVFLSNTVTGNFNALHSFLQSYIGAFHLGLAYFIWATEKETSIDGSLVYARGVAAFFSLFTRLFAAWHLNDKNTRGLQISDYFILTALFTEGVWLATEVARLVLNKRTTQDEVDQLCRRTTQWLEGRGSHYTENALLLDAFVSLAYALFHFAFPHQILKLLIRSDILLDSHHIMWTRAFGGLSLIAALASLQAPRLPPTQLLPYLFSRVITQSLIFALNIGGHWVWALYSPNHISALMLSGFYMSFQLSNYYRAKRILEADPKVRATTRIESTSVRKTK